MMRNLVPSSKAPIRSASASLWKRGVPFSFNFNLKSRRISSFSINSCLINCRNPTACASVSLTSKTNDLSRNSMAAKVKENDMAVDFANPRGAAIATNLSAEVHNSHHSRWQAGVGTDPSNRLARTEPTNPCITSALSTFTFNY